MTVTQNSPVSGEVTIISTASVSGRVQQLKAVVSVNPTSGLVSLISLQPTTDATASTVPIGFVQSTEKEIHSGVTSTSVPFASNTTAGNLIAVAASWSGAVTASVTDTNGNTYTSAIGPTLSSSNWYAQVFYAKNIAGGADTIKVTYSGTTADYSDVYFDEYSGLSTASPLDQTSATGAAVSSTAVDSGSQTTTVSDEFVFRKTR